MEEVRAAAAELNIVLEEKPGFLNLITDMLRPESLPAGWSASYDAASGRRKYEHASSQSVQWVHPLLDYYRGAAYMEAGGYRRMLAAESKIPPTDEEVAEMCTYLHVGLDEDAYVKEVAHMAISAPLPDGWEEVEDEEGGAVMFKNKATGEVKEAHPLDAYFVELIARRRAELQERGAGVMIKSALAAQRLTVLTSKVSAAATVALTAAHWKAVAAKPDGHPASAAKAPGGPTAGDAAAGVEGQGSGLLAATVLPDAEVVREPGPVEAAEAEAEGVREEAASTAVQRAAAAVAAAAPPRPPPYEASLLSPPPQERFLPPQLQAAAARRREALLREAEQQRREAEQREAEAAAAAQQQEYAAAYQEALTMHQNMYLAQFQEAGLLLAAAPNAITTPTEVPTAMAAAGPGTRPHSRQEAWLERLPPLLGAADQAHASVEVDEQSQCSPGTAKQGEDVASRMGTQEAALVSALLAANACSSVRLDDSDSLPVEQVAGRPSRERIRVVVRIRPLPDTHNEVAAWQVDPELACICLKDHLAGLYRGSRGPNRTFQFDMVLGPTATTDTLFEAHVRPLVDDCLAGRNTTCFAYGQTGSGKTHTMFGASEAGLRSGTIGMSLAHLFGSMELAAMNQALPSGKASDFTLAPGSEPGSEQHVVKLSILELYNEQLRDLLGGSSASQAPLLLLDDPHQGVRVQGLTEVEVSGFTQAMGLILSGYKARVVGATALNSTSSRSHTIVRVVVQSWAATPPGELPDPTGPGPGRGGGGRVAGGEQGHRELRQSALLHLVDLAGSERLTKTRSSGMRFTEGTNINLSLLMLGTVIARLAEGRRGDTTADFVPYRNSKLTRLLQPCLGGNACTTVIAAINPSHHHVEETLNTLQFAQRAMAVVNTVQVNRVIKVAADDEQGRLVSELQAQVHALQMQLRAAQATGPTAVPAPPQPRANPPRGSRAQAASAAAVTPAMPSLSQQQTMQLAARLDQLEQDKARLQDRLEALTGQAQGGVWDAPPPTPPGLSLNNDRPVRRAAGAVSRLTAERALRTITRIVNLGRSNAANRADRLKELAAARPPGNGGAGLEGGDPPEVVVASVRRIRGERDELRRRDARLRGQLLAAREALTALEPYAAQQDAVEECVGLLEDLMGRPTSPSLSAGPPLHTLHPASQSTSGGPGGGAGGGPAGGSSASAAGAPPQVPQGERLVARLREGVQSVVLLSSELSHLQRQLMTALALQAAAERRAAELEELWRDSNARACAEAEAHGCGMGAGEALRGSKGWLLRPIEGSGQDGGDVQILSPSRPADGAQGQGQEQQQGAEQQQQQGQERGQQQQGQEGSIQTQQQQQQQQQQQGEAAEPPWKQQARELGHAVAAHQAVSDLSQLLRELQHQNAALKSELGVVKAELNRWRGFTDEQELLISPTSVQPHASPSGAGARSGASQPSLLPSPGTASSPGADSTSTQQVVVVGSMAVRAAREARRRAAAAESQLSSVVQQRDELHARLAQIEAAAGFAGGDAADDAQDAGQFERVKSHVMSLSKEVAALTRERDALLGLVLQAAAATAAHQHDAVSLVGSMPLTTPLFMPPELVAQVFAANDDYGGGGVGVAGAGSQLAALLSHESLLAPHSPSPALPRRAARNRMHGGGGGGGNLLPSLVPSQQQGRGAASVPESKVAGWRNGDLPGRRRGLPGPQSDPGPWEAPRPAFDAAPQPREVYRKLQKMEDRMVMRGQLTPLQGAAKDLAEGGVVANVRDADLLGLKRKLVMLEKERRELEARAATEVRAAQTQLAAMTRQAAAAATAHTARLREVEAEREAEVARVKAEASGAITVLMQENARLKGLLGPASAAQAVPPLGFAAWRNAAV